MWTPAAGSADSMPKSILKPRSRVTVLLKWFIYSLFHFAVMFVFALEILMFRLVCATVSLLAIIRRSYIIPHSLELSADFLTVYRCNSWVLA